MRLRLEHIDTQRLEIELPSAPEGGEQRVVVCSLSGLQGLLEQSMGRLRVSDVQAERLVLEALRLVFGTVVLTERGPARLAQVRASFEQTSDTTSVELATDIHAERLALDVAGVHIEAQARIEGLRLHVKGAHGTVEAAQATLSQFELRVDGVELRSERVTLEGFFVGWGKGLRLQVRRASASTLELAANDTRVQAAELDVQDVRVQGGHVTLGQATIGRASIAASFASDEAAPADEKEVPAAVSAASEKRPAAVSASGERTPEPAPKRFDWRLLDGLQGEVAVDLAVDLTVPVIGRRRATHRFRIPIADGTIDFMRLENDLSTLENTILDFAVRKNALVLERGIPLLPTRGRGKPIVIWMLDDDDLALARRDRVRLSVLPQAQLAGESEAAEGEDPKRETPSGPPKVALRRLGLGNLRVQLQLPSAPATCEGIIERLALASLALEGALHHDPEGAPREGRLGGELTDLETKLRSVPMGNKRLNVDELRLGRLHTFELAFAGLRPRMVQLDLAQIAIFRLTLSPAP